MQELREFLTLLNETLATAIVIVSTSMLLYNLTRNLKNRVARTSGAMLACVTIAYASDVLISLGPGSGTFEDFLRMQWVGLAFFPATMFHLSDALLETTGLPSRGRRRRVVRFLYGMGLMFMLLVAFTDSLIYPEIFDRRLSLRIAPLFWLYALYFVLANGIALFNVQRARLRCQTRSTRRRMAYLQVAMLTPIVGVFPYSVFLQPGEEFSLLALILVNAANMLVILMLVFLAYPLSFFGSSIPDRVVKAELLRFMLRGPATGVLALIVIVYTVPATEFVGVPGETFMPFAVVAVILIWQWLIDLSLPWLENRLIYSVSDDDDLMKFRNLNDQLLTRADLNQQIRSILEATCDYLGVENALVATLAEQLSEIVHQTGTGELTNDILRQEADVLTQSFDVNHHNGRLQWRDYWIMPLFSERSTDSNAVPALNGFMAVATKPDDLSDDEAEMLNLFVRRAGRTLDNMMLQNEVYAALEGLLPQITVTARDDEVEYRPGRVRVVQPESIGLDREQVIEQVRAALRHYWGGPGMSSSRLLDLKVVKQALDDNDNNPVRALRTVLLEAIENQRPEGERDMKSQEWTIYNILTLRFIEKRKARETAKRLYMAEASLYRKQNVAIEALADTLIQMETEAGIQLPQPV